MKKSVTLLLSVLAAFSCNQAPQTSWAPAGDKIMTKWAEQVSPTNARPEYPRPQMVREKWQSLNGLWDYAVTPKDALVPAQWDGQILVPFCVESALSGVGHALTSEEALWYNTTFTVPRSWKERVCLNFDAVDWSAEVYVNDRLAGTHTGGYTACSCDITDLLTGKGPQKLRVKVIDATDKKVQPRGKQVNNPQGIWYTSVSGIWQSVWLEPVAPAHISDYLAVADVPGSSLEVTVPVCGDAEGAKVEIYVREGGVGYSTEGRSKGKTVGFAAVNPGEPVRIAIAEPKLWTPDEPYLYALEISLKQGDKVLDRVKGYTALRQSSVVLDDKGFRRMGLNGKPVFQFGPLDQGWWPDGLYTAPTDEALKFDIEKTKALGYNMIRKHVKVEPSRWYYYCDQIGICVWQDMPCMADNVGYNWIQGRWADEEIDQPLSDEEKAIYYKEWGEIINQLKKFPCIVAWVPFNEAWAQFETAKAVDFTRSLDPTRLINSASGGNSYLVGDILDVHSYPNPKMRFSSEGRLIDVIGEFGGIGWPVEGHLWQTEKNWGYVKYADGDAVLNQYEKYIEELIPAIAEGVSAAVYTQTTDVEGEVNGLMTYDRKVVKMNEERLSAINKRAVDAL